jgi:hypothetical protein
MIVSKQNLKELVKLTLLNILSVKGVLYTHYKNKQKQKGKTMKKTITTDEALLILSDVITFYFEMRGKTDDREELNWRKQVEAAEDLINQKLNNKKVA